MNAEQTDAVELQHTYERDTEISYRRRKKDCNENQLLEYYQISQNYRRSGAINRRIKLQITE